MAAMVPPIHQPKKRISAKFGNAQSEANQNEVRMAAGTVIMQINHTEKMATQVLYEWREVRSDSTSVIFIPFDGSIRTVGNEDNRGQGADLHCMFSTNAPCHKDSI